jgi:hypothetical protein
MLFKVKETLSLRDGQGAEITTRIQDGQASYKNATFTHLQMTASDWFLNRCILFEIVSNMTRTDLLGWAP